RHHGRRPEAFQHHRRGPSGFRGEERPARGGCARAHEGASEEAFLDPNPAQMHGASRGAPCFSTIRTRVKSRRATRRRPASRRRKPRSAGLPGFTLQELAAAVGGRVVGDPDLRLSAVRPLEDAGPQDLSWVAGERRSGGARTTSAGALLVPSVEAAAGKPAVVVDSPPLALARWLELSRPIPRPAVGIARGARVHPTAKIGRGASVAAGAT